MGGPKKSHAALGGCGVSEKKKEARVREGGGSPTRGGGGLLRVGDPLPHEKFSTAFPNNMGPLFRLILTKMAYPHMDTKIPLRVVYPLPPLRVGNPPPSTRSRPSLPTRGDPPPLRIIFKNPLYEWGYLRAFSGVAIVGSTGGAETPGRGKKL